MICDIVRRSGIEFPSDIPAVHEYHCSCGKIWNSKQIYGAHHKHWLKTQHGQDAVHRLCPADGVPFPGCQKGAPWPRELREGKVKNVKYLDKESAAKRRRLLEKAAREDINHDGSSTAPAPAPFRSEMSQASDRRAGQVPMEDGHSSPR